VEFNPSVLPQGWVKEMVCRKIREGRRNAPVYIKMKTKYSLRFVYKATKYFKPKL
jgi:hypothetical protein